MCELTEMVNQYEATRMWEAGEDPSFSSDLIGRLTGGYGRIRYDGNFQFPLIPAEYYLAQVKSLPIRTKTTEIMT